MRLSLATAACVVTVAMLAGCSNPGMGTSSVPGSGTQTAPMGQRSHEHVPNVRLYKPSELTKSHILAMQASGKFATRILHDAFMKGYKHYQSHPRFRPQVSRDGGTCGLGQNLFYYSYMVCFTANAKKTIWATTTYSGSTGCDYPQTAKVDASGNIWTACEYANDTEGAALQEYNTGGTLLAQYTSTCPTGYNCSSYWFSYFFDAAVNTAGECGVAEDYETEWDSYSNYAYGSGLICYTSTSSSVLYPAWQYSNLSSYDIGTECEPICEAWEGDMDSSGDVYFTYDGENSSCFGGGLAREHAGAITVVESPCLLEFPGGVWAAGGYVYVIDQDARVIYKYNDPVNPNDSPVATYGPTQVGIAGIGDPDSGGINAAGNKMVIGDAYGWDDVGKLNNNKWKTAWNINMADTGVEGASYTPSNKP
jgi:hypothetical protein